jgi:phosphohistidine phosphatase
MTGHTLILVRHAKAEPPNSKPDAERALSSRGHDDAGAAGAWLARRGLVPDVVLCSPALRTRQTWHSIAVALAHADQAQPDAALAAAEVRYEPQLYYGGTEETLDLLRALPESATTALVVSHNPTISNVSLFLAPDNVLSGTAGLRTAGLAVHRVHGPWLSCGQGTTELVERHTARA